MGKGQTSSETGIVLLTTLLLTVLLMAVGMAGLGLSRTDLLISRNLLIGVQALWLARTGAEIGKNWLQTNLPETALPVTLGPTAFANGSYAVDVEALGNGAYRLTAVGAGPEDSRRVVEEIVRLPDFAPLGVVTNEGDGLHPDFDDVSGGIGRRIPDFTVDGRNHAPDGTLSALCPAVSPFAVTQAAAQTDLTNAADTLKREIVTRANSFCQSNGSDAAGTCTPGLFWVRGAGASPRFHTNPCVTADSGCFLNLDLSAAALRALASPPDVNLPPEPDNRGPFTAGVIATPFVRAFDSAEQTRLSTALDDMLQRVEELPEGKVSHISTSLHAGNYVYGSSSAPSVVQVDEGVGEIDFDGGVVIDGTGVLFIPRVVRLSNATLNWKGIILITGAGDLRVENAPVCGRVLGAVIIRDDATPDRKFDLDKVQVGGGCQPLAVNYSCETITRALTTLMRTVSWVERYGA